MKRSNSFKATISKEEISKLPIQKFNGEIHFIDTIEKFKSIIAELKTEKTLGFDTETKPTFKKGKLNEVSLLQLSSHSKAYIFRLNKIGLPTELAGILADNSVRKIGVAINDDISSLRKLNEFKPSDFIDLQPFVKDYDILDNGLKKLTANILGFKISKRQQTSNWELEKLTQAQIEYAATDAWVCYEIYVKLTQ